MFSLLIRLCIKNYEEVEKPSVRKAYGNLASLLGMSVNILLSVLKMGIGWMTGSIAIVSDGMHNLVDGASAVISMISFRVSGREPDMEHPYGHGRFEYIASLGMGVAVIVLGVQFLIASYERIQEGHVISMGTLEIVLFALSILGTVFIYLMYTSFAKRIDSHVLQAAGAECFADLISSVVILIGLIVSRFYTFPVDGYLGVAVALLICHSGYSILKESTSALLGNEPKPEQVSRIRGIIASYDGVLGIHDLMIHDYGPGRVFASVHVEVDARDDIIACHDLVDSIEKKIYEELGIHMTIHMDPIVQNEELLHTYTRLSRVIHVYNAKYILQDLRMRQDGKHKLLSFEVVVPFGEKKTHRQIQQDIQELIEVIDASYITQVTIKECYVGSVHL